MRRRRWIIAMAAVAGLLGVTAAAVAIAAPAVAATACPQCYGLTSLGDGVYAERDDPAYRPMLDAADARITAFYGGRTVEPRVLICATGACYRRIGGGGEKGRTIRTWALLLSPKGATETIATHELSHGEFHQRLGAARDRVPQWFDEGLAVLVSEDERYLRPGAGAARCRVPLDEALAITRTDWSAPSPGPVDGGYLRAACVVSDWAHRNGGPSAVLTLIDRLRAGAAFEEVVTVP
ncbi:hypothetical protein AB0F81_36455 [Actinoplanes sp. NPDC024001]|uniref:hypothetical protein n=1 Tax=Actinoplanes sp. NPDC024001 TaxID=3154598 RepID=UPI0033D902F5